MAPIRRIVWVARGLFFSVVFFSVVITTSLLIQDVFAYSGNDGNMDDVLPAELSYQTSLAYSPSYNTTFQPKHVSAVLITEHVDGITYGTTVRDALRDLGINLTDNFIVRPSADTIVTDGMVIKINEYTAERSVEEETIPFQSVTYLDDTRELETTTVVQTGLEGKKKVVYEYAYIDGIFTTRTPVREEVLVTPQNEIVAIGTMRIFRPMMIGVDSFSYWKVMRVFATSYDANCEGCNQWTATGAIVDKGICAVDPTIIPMHAHFYVPGYGFCVAEDVGGAVKGARIDLGFDDLRHHQGEWSARYVDIYLMD
jgi:3D (Asp-Asp-Asp) domain-containing protein